MSAFKRHSSSYIPGTFWFGRFDGMKKMDQIEEANVGIALVTARLDNEEMVHFLPSRRDPYGAEIGQNQACWVYTRNVSVSVYQRWGDRCFK